MLANGRQLRCRLLAGLVALAMWACCAAPLWAADEEFDSSAAAPEGKAYVNQYFFVGALLGGGIFLLCRPSRRRREVKTDREVRTASKDGANV